MGVGGQHYAPTALAPRKRPVNPCLGGWVDARTNLDGCGKISTPLAFNPWAVQPIAS